MKITPDVIQLESLEELNGFVADLELNGQFQFAQPVLDNSENVLIREGIVVKPAMLQRLESMAGQYKPHFQVSVTKELLLAIRARLAPAFFDQLRGPRAEFVRCLFEYTRHNYRNYVKNAIRDPRLLLAVYRLSRERPEFFAHAATLAMLSLGILLQTNARRRMIHIKAFQAGLTADFGLAESDEWRSPAGDVDAQRKRAQRSIKNLAGFELGPEIIQAIQNHPIDIRSPQISSVQFGAAPDAAPDVNFFDDPASDGDAPVESPGPHADFDAVSAEILTECLRLARFIDDTARQISDLGHFAEELVYMTAYNAARGYFHTDFIAPLLRVFQEYESGARRLMKVAEIEQRCKHPPSAWAYPKPRAAQILCRDHRDECPWIVRGWDIHVISPHDAYGWIGVDLPAGNYSKCQLNEELEKLPPPAGAQAASEAGASNKNSA
ncbi:MAG: hypothetical protein K1X75_03695 [Leptospirales bacterium]|nr:hypothetical protein [Leptospirales bacterium]